MAAVDPRNSRVIAFYSGRDYLKSFTNNAFDAYKQVASAFKPYVLAAWHLAARRASDRRQDRHQQREQGSLVRRIHPAPLRGRRDVQGDPADRPEDQEGHQGRQRLPSAQGGLPGQHPASTNDDVSDDPFEDGDPLEADDVLAGTGTRGLGGLIGLEG
ncbi:hypothetical protein AB0K16_20790 [Nonomuraea jabiensis]|uniref:hypothetical protein n=1 Tax=Nonomuraea jabiensis TaxID=882448 RepID=UPI003449D5CD